MTTKLQFILFYSVFILFTIELGVLAGVDIFQNSPDFAGVPTDSATLLNPLTAFGFWIGLLTISVEYQVIYTVIFLPLIVGLAWSFVEMARGI
jgi:hypothetical protein